MGQAYKQVGKYKERSTPTHPAGCTTTFTSLQTSIMCPIWFALAARGTGITVRGWSKPVVVSLIRLRYAAPKNPAKGLSATILHGDK